MQVINAKGNYLYFLDSDDWINENTLEELYFNLLREMINMHMLFQIVF